MKINHKYITFVIVLVSFLIRLYRLDIPHDWSFDEVYHGLSAEAYALNDPRGYEWWHQGPKDLAYEWLHPPLGKVFMALSINTFSKAYIPESKAAPLDGATTFAWRFPGIIFAAITVWLLIVFGQKLFKNYWVGAMAGMLYGLDGLSFVQSRTGMNDIYVTFFVVLTFYLLYRFLSEYPHKTFKWLYLVGVASGLAASTKWTGFYVVAIAFLVGISFLLKKWDLKKIPWAIVTLALIPPVIYILSYSQWWYQGHTWKQFYELHQQIWWYQTNLKATHDYQSKALTWPLLIRPVWFYVKYEDRMINNQKVLHIGNIYTMGHPLIWWAGLGAIGYLLWNFLLRVRKVLLKDSHLRKNDSVLLPFSIILIGYFGMFLPWAASPRIMFMYHYLPSVPFLCLALAYGLYTVYSSGKAGKWVVWGYLLLVVLGFVYFYPHWSALLMPQKWVNQYYWLKSWK